MHTFLGKFVSTSCCSSISVDSIFFLSNCFSKSCKCCSSFRFSCKYNPDLILTNGSVFYAISSCYQIPSAIFGRHRKRVCYRVSNNLMLGYSRRFNYRVIRLPLDPQINFQHRITSKTSPL